MCVEYITNKNQTDTIIIYLHGWGQDKSSMSRFVEISKYKAYALDLMPDNMQFGYDVYDYAIRVFTFIKQIEYKHLIIVGHSFGGRIAIILSSIFDLPVKKLVLIDSAGIVQKSFSKFIKVKMYKICKRLHIKLFTGSKDYQKLNDTQKLSFIKIVNEDLLFLAKKICVPTILVWGKNDIDTPISMAKTFHKNIKNSKLQFVSGTHFAYWKHTYFIQQLIEGET